MKQLSALAILLQVGLFSPTLAQAATISPAFQGTWINIANPSERHPYCQANIKDVDAKIAKDFHVITISPSEIQHHHFDKNGGIVHIHYDNLRFKAHTDTQIRGLSRRDYQSAISNRVYKAYSFRYDLANQQLTSPSLSGQAFYRCY